MIDPFVEPVRWSTVDGVNEIADRLNAVADLAATYGLSVGYHNHAQEFLIDIDGRSALEHVVARTDERVAIELGYHVLDVLLSAEESAAGANFVAVESTLATPVPVVPRDMDPFARTL